jgi:hypothetical protein
MPAPYTPKEVVSRSGVGGMRKERAIPFRDPGDGEAHHPTGRTLRWAIFSPVTAIHRFLIDGLRAITHDPSKFDRSALGWGRFTRGREIEPPTLLHAAWEQLIPTICLRG